VKIECDIEPLAPQPPCQAQIVGHAPRAARLWCDDHLVEVWIVRHNRRRVRFDDVRKMR
jgi:hypothetical protein